ncbi:MAG: hypothetical protein K2X81_19595, partial [Candidatus Obscuribacterales bacterium]|nr:hypothetical protein [Candidatus Obscuribacterales bacterium]
MCYACLHDFQERLKRIFGVERARVEKSTQVTIQSFSPDLSNWAEAVIFYDSKALELADLRAFMKANGYFSYKVLVKQVDQLPAEDQKKI